MSAAGGVHRCSWGPLGDCRLSKQTQVDNQRGDGARKVLADCSAAAGVPWELHGIHAEPGMEVSTGCGVQGVSQGDCSSSCRPKTKSQLKMWRTNCCWMTAPLHSG